MPWLGTSIGWSRAPVKNDFFSLKRYDCSKYYDLSLVLVMVLKRTDWFLIEQRPAAGGQAGLTSESVEGAALPLEGVDNLHGGDRREGIGSAHVSVSSVKGTVTPPLNRLKVVRYDRTWLGHPSPGIQSK